MEVDLYNTSQGNQYALGKTGEIVSISKVDPSDRYALGPFKCIECGCNMVPHKGRIREHHFKHHGPRTPACADETYLHFLAKTTLYDALREAMESNKPYFVSYERPLVCDRYLNDFDYICRSECAIEQWDVTRSFDRVELETAHAGFIPDVLLFSNKSEEVIYLEIKVSHGCEPEKIKSGIRIIEIEVIGEDDIHRLGEGISLQDHNVKAYNLKQVKPKEKQCHKPCSVTGTAFAVFESGKTRVLTEPLNELLRVRSRRSTKFFKFLGANEYFAPWDYTPVYFENSVEAQFNEGVDVRSCLLCRKCGLGKFEKPIFCFEQGIETAINTAYNCRFFAPVATEEEARKRFERSLNYLERSGLQTGSAAALSGMDIDAELFEE